MNISGRTILIVGGTAGIGHGLAQRFAEAGSTVIVGGRNSDQVESIETVRIDVTDPASVLQARDTVLERHPDLDLIVTMSGIMLTEDLRDPAHIEQAEQMIAVNLLGTIRVIDAFTPHLIGRGAGDIITVSSGIGFLPFPLMATYGASKAAVHSYSESLRAHLAGTGIGVTELVPPAVANAGQEKLNPRGLRSTRTSMKRSISSPRNRTRTRSSWSARRRFDGPSATAPTLSSWRHGPRR